MLDQLVFALIFAKPAFFTFYFQFKLFVHKTMQSFALGPVRTTPEFENTAVRVHMNVVPRSTISTNGGTEN